MRSRLGVQLLLSFPRAAPHFVSCRTMPGVVRIQSTDDGAAYTTGGHRRCIPLLNDAAVQLPTTSQRSSALTDSRSRCPTQPGPDRPTDRPTDRCPLIRPHCTPLAGLRRPHAELGGKGSGGGQGAAGARSGDAPGAKAERAGGGGAHPPRGRWPGGDGGGRAVGRVAPAAPHARPTLLGVGRRWEQPPLFRRVQTRRR